MENNINMKQNNNSMKTNKKIVIGLYLFFVALVFMFNINATNGLLHWDFEEGGGVLALDSTGNNNNGLINKPQYTTTHKFGVYGQDFNSDFVSSLTSFMIPTNMTVSLWFKQIDNSRLSTYWSVGTSDELHDIYFDESNNDLHYEYIDTGLVTRDIIITNMALDNNNWHHIVYTINKNTSHVKFYIDNVNIYDNVLTNQIHNSLSQSTLILADDKLSIYKRFQGTMDSFRVIDTFVNDSQVNELFTTNTITLPVTIPEVVLNGTNQAQSGTIINSLTPLNNQTLFNPVKITGVLNIESTCNVYFENDLVSTFENVLAFNYELPILKEDNYSYFVYCDYIDTNLVKHFEISNTTTFTINSSPPNEITFNILGNDFIVNDKELYITTPCMDKGFSAVGTDYKPYQPKYNTGGILFSKVENGLAKLIVNGETNEYCLYNGRIIINEEGKTTNYDPVDILGVVELGNILTPNNITSTYTLKLDQFDIYGKADPKAWGESWTSIIGGLMLLVLGVILLIAGMAEGNGKIAIAGTLLVLSALGISLNAFVGFLV